MILHCVFIYRVASQNGHSALTGELAVSLGIPWTTQPTVAVKVEACTASGIGRQCKHMRICDACFFQLVAQRVDRDQIVIIVDIQKQQNIGGCLRDDLCDRTHLRVFAIKDIAQKQCRTGPCQACVIDSDDKRVGQSPLWHSCERENGP